MIENEEKYQGILFISKPSRLINKYTIELLKKLVYVFSLQPSLDEYSVVLYVPIKFLTFLFPIFYENERNIAPSELMYPRESTCHYYR